MASVFTGPAQSTSPRAEAARRRRAKRRRRLNPAERTGAAILALFALLLLIELGVRMVRADPRDTRAIAERELEVNTLQPGERVIRSVSVFQRRAIDYFRATRGLLVLTNKRLLYLGVEPRDLLAAPDLPPTFEEQDFPLDTLVAVSSGRTFFGLAKAVVIRTPKTRLRLGVPSVVSSRANLLVIDMQVRHDRAVAAAAQQRTLLANAEAARRRADAERRKPKYYTVQRGDALGSIATMWNVTPDKLRAWNHLPSNQIRVGEVLLVKPQT